MEKSPRERKGILRKVTDGTRMARAWGTERQTIAHPASHSRNSAWKCLDQDIVLKHKSCTVGRSTYEKTHKET